MPCWLVAGSPPPLVKPLPAHGIGTWGDVLWLQTWLAVLTNLAIFGFSSEQMKTWLPSWFVVDNLGAPARCATQESHKPMV